MSHFTYHSAKRIEQLTKYMLRIINGKDWKKLIDKYDIIKLEGENKLIN